MDKQAVRETVWDAFEERGEARFPFPPHDRIPNFAGADAACDRLTDTDAWASASTLKCNPDAPQLPCDAPRSGTEKRCTSRRRGSRRRPVPPDRPRRSRRRRVRRLESADVDADGPTVDDATTVSGISTHGTPVAPEDVPHVDLVVAGSVGVTTDGARIGKGEGYSDLEWGVLSELGAVDREAQSASGSEGQSPSGNRASPGDSRAKPDDGDHCRDHGPRAVGPRRA